MGTGRGWRGRLALAAWLLGLVLAPAAAARPAGPLHGPVARAGALPAATRRACARLRAPLGEPPAVAVRRPLRVLVTGDSMIYPIDEELARWPASGMRVYDSRHDGTGLTTQTVDWTQLAKRQAIEIRPDVTIVSLGGRDGGIPLLDGRSGRLVECCGSGWLALYAQRERRLAESWMRDGSSLIYWLTLPAPREAARAPLFAAVNAATRLLAAQFPHNIRLIEVDRALSPYGYRTRVDYDGVLLTPRTPDGIHLDHEGGCVEWSLLMGAMRADGLIAPARPAAVR